ncbi:MAG TPA: GtrA family protein [Nitrolancea sp.]|nr:GtrA family protein [Nitrolancea sp.]
MQIVDLTTKSRRSTTKGKSFVRFVQQFFLFFLGDPARLGRFAVTGAIAAGVQLGVLHVLTADHWNALLANGIGMAAAAQVNFTLSSIFTWRDRWEREGLIKRWSMYQLTILISAIVNMLVFIVARLVVEQTLAAVIGILAAATLNFAAGDRLIFRLKRVVASLEHETVVTDSGDPMLNGRKAAGDPMVHHPVEIEFPVYAEESALTHGEAHAPDRERGDHS